MKSRKASSVNLPQAISIDEALSKSKFSTTTSLATLKPPTRKPLGSVVSEISSRAGA
eukprot:CAMPEP_0197697088 /NCGR_PEP_ID=MMETSP1338-20131121/117504_1 /TAXON_ID=43686 ORGANISM="Pelagodinium beii, Strain RCC1491" /NCGR_SAMPLE_ID=MMETSP1338 /ASSEMBLY_ACC=CAM_ASM_000754 /LENGTH=56 /DNA_ID=CAMNT_0043280295 /DNA_START=335 /DNA_END=505 /DNA_ORIENTATION=-